MAGFRLEALPVVGAGPAGRCRGGGHGVAASCACAATPKETLKTRAQIGHFILMNLLLWENQPVLSICGKDDLAFIRLDSSRSEGMSRTKFGRK
jgi:hypothetical protein